MRENAMMHRNGTLLALAPIRIEMQKDIDLVFLINYNLSIRSGFKRHIFTPPLAPRVG